MPAYKINDKIQQRGFSEPKKNYKDNYPLLNNYIGNKQEEEDNVRIQNFGNNNLIPFNGQVVNDNFAQFGQFNNPQNFNMNNNFNNFSPIKNNNNGFLQNNNNFNNNGMNMNQNFFMNQNLNIKISL